MIDRETEPAVVTTMSSREMDPANEVQHTRCKHLCEAIHREDVTGLRRLRDIERIAENRRKKSSLSDQDAALSSVVQYNTRMHQGHPSD